MVFVSTSVRLCTSTGEKASTHTEEKASQSIEVKAGVDLEVRAWAREEVLKETSRLQLFTSQDGFIASLGRPSRSESRCLHVSNPTKLLQTMYTVLWTYSKRKKLLKVTKRGATPRSSLPLLLQAVIRLS